MFLKTKVLLLNDCGFECIKKQLAWGCLVLHPQKICSLSLLETFDRKGEKGKNNYIHVKNDLF